MPSGRTHDRITLWGLPFLAGISFRLTQSGNNTLIVCGAFLFSGLMFGPDLDLRSRQYRRWGPLRWIWIPYQKTLRHRSVLSHGPIVGTALRVLYLAAWLGILGVFGWGIAQTGVWRWSWQPLQPLKASLTQYPSAWIALCLGLELGAMSHSLCDWGSSAYKRHHLPPRDKMKKRSKPAQGKRQKH